MLCNTVVLVIHTNLYHQATFVTNMLRFSTAVVNRRSLLNWRGGGRDVGLGGCHPCWAQVWKIINREFSPGLTVAATSGAVPASPPLRRRRKSAFPFENEDAKGGDSPDRGGLREAFQPTEVSFDEYIKTVSLSPWVPVPDVVARKMLDIAQLGPEDVRFLVGYLVFLLLNANFLHPIAFRFI
jgi:hypothetical protein